jgi:hypothetical protein
LEAVSLSPHKQAESVEANADANILILDDVEKGLKEAINMKPSSKEATPI